MCARKSEKLQNMNNSFSWLACMQSVFDRVRTVGSVSIPTDGPKELSQRSRWSGRIVLSKEGVLDSSGRIGAYLKDLANILTEHLSPNEMIECTASVIEDQMSLRIKLVEPTLSTEKLGDFYLLISSGECFQ